MPHPTIIKEFLVIIGFAIIVAFIVNYLPPRGIALFGQWDTSRGITTPKSKDDMVAQERDIMDIRAGKKIFDSGTALFVDARTQELYEVGHIKGAVSLPVGQFDLLIDEFMDRYPTDTEIITYCSGRECNDSHKLAQYIFEMEYTRIKVLIDGYPGWEVEGYPLE